MEIWYSNVRWWPQLSNLWWMPKLVINGFATDMRKWSSRHFKNNAMFYAKLLSNCCRLHLGSTIYWRVVWHSKQLHCVCWPSFSLTICAAYFWAFVLFQCQEPCHDDKWLLNVDNYSKHTKIGAPPITP